MKLGSINATGTAVVKCGKISFVSIDTPRCIGAKAFEAGLKVGSKLTVTTNYPGWGRESRVYKLTLDANGGFAQRS
jgi:hypothetical protein